MDKDEMIYLLLDADIDSEWYRIAPAVWECNSYASRLIKEAMPVTNQNVQNIPKRMFNLAP